MEENPELKDGTSGSCSAAAPQDHVSVEASIDGDSQMADIASSAHVGRKGNSSRGETTRVVGTVFAWLMIALGAVTFAGGHWIVKTFGYITPDQLKMNMTGVGGETIGGSVVRSGVIEIAVVPLIIVLAAFALWIWARNRLSGHYGLKDARTQLVTAVAVALAIASPLVGLSSMASATQFRQYLAANDPNLDVGDFYVEPTVIPNPDNPKYNLVVIYLESAEETLGREDILGQNLLESIDRVTGDWDRVSRLEQYKNFGWTMAGFVGTQCGVPLRAASSEPIDPSEKNDAGILNGWTESTYMDSAVCLGDVLKDQGYTSVYMGAANASFAGKGTFLTSHGYDTVRAGEEWSQRDDLDQVPEWWGPSDGAIMDLAKEEILELREAGDPFALTLLTVDTHEPALEQSYCKFTTEIEMESVVMCSMDQVAGFLEFLEDTGFMEDTVVVVMGDHLRMAGALDDKLTVAEDRTVFNRIHVPDDRTIQVESIDQLSMYPTILEAVGISLEDNRAGLGVSAFTPNIKYGTLRSLSDDERRQMIASRSQDFYDSLWEMQSTSLAGSPSSSNSQ